MFRLSNVYVTFMTVLREIRSLALLPLMAWVVMKLVMTGMFLPVSLAHATSTDDFAYVICTPSGLKIISAEGEELPTGHELAEEVCKWCHSLGKVAPLPASAPEVARVAFAELDLKPATLQPNIYIKHYEKCRYSRAPPQLSV